MPGFTNISMYPKLMEDLGYNNTVLLDKLIEMALKWQREKYYKKFNNINDFY